MTTTHQPASAPHDAPSVAPLTFVARRHPWRWVSAAVVAGVFAMLVNTLVTNERWRWKTVAEYFFDRRIIAGLGNTLVLTAVAMAVGVILGVIVAMMRLSKNPLVRSGALGYTWFFRATPVFVQIIFWYNISALYPRVSIGLPFGVELFGGNANRLVTPFVAAILALGLNEGAYMAEIVRAGMLSVDRGQVEAAHALGMTSMTTMRRVILPRALRVIIPPTGNQFIGMLKVTSLVSVIAYTELLYAAQLIYAQNFKTMPLLIVVSIWYMLATTVLSVGQYFLERHFGRSANLGEAR